ncbi:MAG: PD40 domain-containing protein [Candidatus Aminicenantes bacterium]|nr:PD40 domain-containing protein [Candidatus Aminicenantes bacterium]
MKKIIIAFCLFAFMAVISYSQEKNFPELKGPYLGQKPPGKKPEIFAPGIVSTGFPELFIYFTPDAKEVYFQLWKVPFPVIIYMKEKNGQWTKPAVAPFSGRYFAKFCLSPDGNTIVLTSSEPRSGRGEPTKKYTTRIMKRTKNGWSDPVFIEQTCGALAPSISSQGNLYFFFEVSLPDKSDIYVSKYKDGAYESPVRLSDSVNSEFYEVDPFIAPDESYLIFCRDGDGFGSTDLFISFRKEDGSWSKAKNMGENINSAGIDLCPSISPDGKYFFFSSDRNDHKSYSRMPLTYEQKIEILSSPGNGLSDIYWVDAKIIERIKPEELK